MRLFRNAFLIVLVITLLNISIFAQKAQQGNIESKIAIETNLENRLRKVLTEIIGTDKIIVIVSVQLASEKKEEEKEEKKEDDFILPGVPIKEAISEKQVGDAVMAALGDDTRTLIKKLTATVILDKGVSSSIEKVVKEVSTGILGIEEERGDQLVIQKIRFQKNPFTWTSLIYPPNIYWVLSVFAAVVLSIAVTLFLFGPFKVFTKEFATGLMAAAAAIRENAKTEGEEGFFKAAPGQELAAQAGAESKETAKAEFGGKEAPFSFINDDNLKALVHLVKNESPKTIATIINYLSPNLSSKILKYFPLNVQNEIFMSLSKVEELDVSEVDMLEANLKKRIGFLAGGSDKLINLLEYSDDKFKNQFLATLQSSNADLANAVKKTMMTLDILITLDAAGLQTVIRAVGAAGFSRVMKGMSEQLRQKILGVLPQGAAVRLKQEIDLAKALSPQQLDIEKRRIINVLKRMEAQGIITRHH